MRKKRREEACKQVIHLHVYFRIVRILFLFFNLNIRLEFWFITIHVSQRFCSIITGFWLLIFSEFKVAKNIRNFFEFQPIEKNYFFNLNWAYSSRYSNWLNDYSSLKWNFFLNKRKRSWRKYTWWKNMFIFIIII